MKCAQCQRENAAGAAFCRECGAGLEAACPGCGAANPALVRYCTNCGRRLIPPIAARVLGSRAALEGERKQVTVLFADMQSSMQLLAGRDPEEARALLDPVLQLMMAAVHRYDGTVNQVMGDGIMALFGAPMAHEDHAARACYAALAMQDGIRRYAQELEGLAGSPVQIRVGLNSGEVVVRAIGNDLRMDYSAIGETTHLASRMESMAPPGAIYLTRATLRLVEPFVHARPLGPMVVKGRREPLQVFELLASRTIRRIEAAAVRGLTRFVGRERELAALHGALDRAVAGHGSVVVVSGEPGIGKSRLLLEFTHGPAVAGCLVLEAATVSHRRTTAYLPLLELLRRYFGIQDTDARTAVREKVTGPLLRLDPALAESAPPILALLGAVSEADLFATYDPVRRRELTQEALRSFLLRLSAAEPVILIIEDLQWVDAETQAFLDGLLEVLPAARVLLVVSHRDEARHDWAGRHEYRHLPLDPLADHMAEALLGSLLGDEPELTPLKRLLIERADGNPFFLEESVRALVDSGSLVGAPGRYRPIAALQPHVPATVQAVLAARIDRLPPEAKRVLQCASVIGREAALGLLEAMAEVPPDDLSAALRHLTGGNFLSRGSAPHGAIYAFRHSLTHEVAYGGLLHEQARSLHASVVAAMERLYADQLGPHAEALAHHAVRAELWPQAVDYLRRAGAMAFARGAIDESMRCYEHALALADRLEPTGDNIGRRIDARLDLHVPLIVLGQVPRLVELHGESERLARDHQDAARLGRVLYRTSQYAWMQGRFAEGLERAEQALDIARGRGDTETSLLASYALGLNRCLLGTYHPAIDLFAGIVDGPEAERAKRLLAVTVPLYVGAASWLGYSLTLVGEIDRALHYSDLAAQAADESDHPQAQAVAYTLRVLPLLYRGQADTALALSERALRLCETRMLVVWYPAALATLGWGLALTGRPEDGAGHLERAAAMMEAVGVRSNLSRVHVWWADALTRAGRPADARPVAEQALGLARTYDEEGYEAEALHALASALASAEGGDVTTAVDLYERARALAVTLGLRPLVARCHLGLGRLHSAAGAHEDARAHFAQAARLFEETQARLWLRELPAPS